MKVPLLEYLDRLEATAKAAPTSYVLFAAKDCAPATRAHIEATQPKATLALIAKLRELLGLLNVNRVGFEHRFAEASGALEIEVPE